MIRILIIAHFIFVSSRVVFSQEETNIEEVIITPRNENENSIQLDLSGERILNKVANDLGQILTLFPGIQVKNYGDVGGLKTVSFRSLGAGHTVLVQDFSAVSTTQSGQADMSTIPADFIQRVELITLSPTRVDLPIHAKLAGAVVNVETLHAHSQAREKKVIFGIQGGSFDQYEAFGMGKMQQKKISGAISGKFRSYGGSFPYSYQNGNTTIQERRKNNSLLEYYGTLSFQYQLNKYHTFQFKVSGNDYKKELAGAVIFYNSNAAQYLNGYGITASLNHRFQKNKWKVFSSINFQKNNLQYLDSSFLNTQGYLDSRFYATQTDFQIQANYRFNEKIELLAGSSFISEVLNGSSLNRTPYRNTSESMLGFMWKWLGKITAQLGFQGVFEKRNMEATPDWNILPAFSWSFDLGKKQKIAFLYRYTLRQPNFSELYYQQLTNSDLKTEKAHIASVRYELTLPFKNGISQTMIQPFYSRMNDKILAIPTKNLFIWSIQNIGQTEAFGTEVTKIIQKKVKKSTFGARFNYTFQYAKDISNPQSATYNHVLSYSPLHSGSMELNYSWKKLSFFILGSYLGERYALNQNIPSNLLEGYFLLDCGAAYTQQIKKSELTLRFTINNLTNKQYYYINYFVMPGTHFHIRLQYAL